MAIINELLRCNRWKTCENTRCEHISEHYEKAMTMPDTGRSICYHDRCKGHSAMCEPVYKEANWEV